MTELTATVTGNTKNLKASDFTVKSEATNVVYPVSKVTVDSKDASKVTLTLFSELKDAATYDVTLDGITKTFVASMERLLLSHLIKLQSHMLLRQKLSWFPKMLMVLS